MQKAISYNISENQRGNLMDATPITLTTALPSSLYLTVGWSRDDDKAVKLRSGSFDEFVSEKYSYTINLL